MSVTMALGAKQLAAKKVIVKRLTAVEELASVSVLCSDKTGTLTLNELTFDEPWLTDGYTADDILLYSYLAAEPGANDPIETAVRRAAEASVDILRDRPANQRDVPGYKVTQFDPFDPIKKMTTATIKDLETGQSFRVAKGAPQVITRLVGGNQDAVIAVNALARRGLRALGVAKTVPGDLENFELVGMISLLDPPRPDSADTIRDCNSLGVDVKMITGDQMIIAKEVAARLGMGRVILDANHLVDPTKSEDEVTEHCQRADGFAQVIPEHKYRVVELLQNKGLLVGMTGDGVSHDDTLWSLLLHVDTFSQVNDAPALKKANVGIAVEGCTDAARSAADIVLLAPGLSTIIDGVKTSRAIFQRLRSYALYRITSTIHFLIFMFIITLVENWRMPAILLIMICVLVSHGLLERLKQKKWWTNISFYRTMLLHLWSLLTILRSLIVLINGALGNCWLFPLSWLSCSRPFPLLTFTSLGMYSMWQIMNCTPSCTSTSHQVSEQGVIYIL